MDRLETNTVQFDIKTLSENPSFNFLNNIVDNDDDDSSFFITSNGSSSPYDITNINCTYSAIDECIKNENNYLTVLSLNVQSLNSKFSEIKDMIYEMHSLGSAPDVICLQELWQVPDSSLFKINGYQELQFRLRADNVQGGGVGIFVRNGLNFVIEPVLSIFQDRILETLFIEIATVNKKVILGSVYRPNSHPTISSGDQFDISMELFTNLLSTINEKNMTAFIFGDFNIDVLKYGKCQKTTDYIELLFSQGFIQTVTKPTRCTNNSASLIDHCITNSTTISHETFILTSFISDHFPILCNLSTTAKEKNCKFIQGRNFSETNLAKFKDSLRAINWELIYSLDNSEDAYNYFLETFLSLYDIFFPLTKTRFNINYHKVDPWFTSGLLRSRREKIKLDKIATKSRSDLDITKYKTYRNLYNKVVRNAKKLYFNEQLSKHQSNMKKTWQLLRCAINKKSKNKEQSIPGIFHNNLIVTQPSKIADIFNDFFTTAPEKIVNQISVCPDLDLDPPIEENQNTPIFQSADLQVGHDEIFDALKLLEPKKSQDFNDISMNLLKNCINEIISPLKHIIDLSFKYGTIPDQMKIAKIVPIFKSGDPRNIDNYRPISLLSNFSKILEKIMYLRLTSFLETNNILSCEQFGFRKGHSTVHPMIHLSNYITKAFNEKKSCTCHFL